MENELCYRKIMQEEFNYRVEQNSAYSLRAFARDIEINPSQLSDIFKGKVGLGSKKALIIAKKLGLNEHESLVFKALVEREHGRAQHIKDRAEQIIEQNNFGEKFKSLTDDSFKIISDWYNFAILSAMELDQYDGSTRFLSNNLNISIFEVEESLKRLLKLDLIDLKDGKFLKIKDYMPTTTHNIPSHALKRFHKQHLNKSLSAIDEVPVEFRDITTMTMAIDLSRIKEAKELIKKFRRSFCQIMESGNKNHVYNLNLQLIPLSKLDSR